MAGGFTGGTSLLRDLTGRRGSSTTRRRKWLHFGMSVTLTRLGTEMGQEQRNGVDFQAGIWNAVWLSGRRFFLAGDGHFGVVDLDKTATVPIDDRLAHRTQTSAARSGSTRTRS